MRAAIFGYKYDDSLDQFIKQITVILKKNNVIVDDGYFDTQINEDHAQLETLYKKINKILLKADVVIVENTEYSVGIGFIIGKASEMKKPVLVLFNKELHKIPSTVIKAYQLSTRFEFQEYTMETLEAMTVKFLKDSKKLLNTKYLFNLTPDMAKYLQWNSETYNRPMVDILRELLDQKMKDHKEWQDYIKD